MYGICLNNILNSNLNFCFPHKLFTSMKECCSALALLLVMPLTLIGQTNTNADQPLTNVVPSASDQDVEEELYILPEFVVSNDQDEGYYSANSTSVTRTNTLVKNSPISMSIVNEQLLDDLNILSTQDLAMVSAAIDEDPSGFSLDRIRIRGFRNSFPRFNFFKRNLPTDSYNIARVDIIKGANSLIFGQASPGGSVSNSPILANFRENTKAVSAAVGIKDIPAHDLKRQSDHQRQFRDTRHGCP